MAEQTPEARAKLDPGSLAILGLIGPVALMTVRSVARVFGMNMDTAHALVGQLVEDGHLVEFEGNQFGAPRDDTKSRDQHELRLRRILDVLKELRMRDLEIFFPYDNHGQAFNGDMDAFEKFIMDITRYGSQVQGDAADLAAEQFARRVIQTHEEQYHDHRDRG